MTKRSRDKRVSVDLNDTVALKVQLQEEITKLERQLHHFRLSDEATNLGKLMSFQEMINSRRSMLERLPRLPD